jgi:SRSO17 transposase
MDAEGIRRLRPELEQYLKQFDDCFARRDTRGHMPKYVEGQLSDLPRKSVEPVALKVGVPVRTLQEFLSQHAWDHVRMRDRLQQLVAQEHRGEVIGILDDTGMAKKGDKTPGVQRQYCGSVGKQDNCFVMVNLGYAVGDFHCLLDGELFLPESWSQDRERCRAAGIPDDVLYRPKTEIALELYDQARANGVVFDWLTFDEWYGVKPAFLRALDRRDQKFLGEVHQNYVAWIDPPQVTNRPFRRGKRSRSRKVPRLVAGSRKPQYVKDLLKDHPALRDQAWQRWRVKDGQKGPMVWEVKHVMIYPQTEDGLPDQPYHLLVCRNVLEADDIKFFVSNAPPQTTVEKLLRVAFSRWRIERCFEDGKGEIGLDHYEGRKYVGLKRHWILSAVSYFFLAKVHANLRGKKPRTDRLPSAHRRSRAGAIMVAG